MFETQDPKSKENSSRHESEVNSWNTVDNVTNLAVLLGPNPSNREDLAICSFFTNFVLVPRHHEAFRGFLDGLPSLFSNAPVGSVLALATSAVSLAIVGGHPTCHFEAALSQQAFGKALVMTRKAIQDPIESLKDETLLAVLVCRSTYLLVKPRMKALVACSSTTIRGHQR